jgi:hypothetical protein
MRQSVEVIRGPCLGGRVGAVGNRDRVAVGDRDSIDEQLHGHSVGVVTHGDWAVLDLPVADRDQEMGRRQANADAPEVYRGSKTASQRQHANDQHRHERREEPRTLVEWPKDVQRQVKRKQPGEHVATLGEEPQPAAYHDDC